MQSPWQVEVRHRGSLTIPFPVFPNRASGPGENALPRAPDFHWFQRDAAEVEAKRDPREINRGGEREMPKEK